MTWVVNTRRYKRDVCGLQCTFNQSGHTKQIVEKMGNVLEAIEKELELSPLEDEQPETLAIEEEELENIIDLDSAEYKQWLQAKREREGRTQDAEKCLIRIGSHSYRVQPLSEQAQAATPAQISLPKSNSQEFNRRSGDSERRIAEMRKKYNLTNRDYKRRGSVVLILDDKRALKGEKEQRQKMRQEMRRKYQLPSHRPRSQVMAG